MLSNELLDKLVALFDEEQKAAIEFTQGNREMTIQKQIKYYYGDQFPYTDDEEEFLSGFALAIERNAGTICKLASLKEYRCILAKKDSFQDSNLIISDKDKNSKTRSIGNNQRVFEVLATDKSRGGNCQRSEDYDGLEELYELQDKKELRTDLQFNFKSINHEKKLKDLGSTPNLGLTTEPFATLTDTKDSDKKIEELKKGIEEMPSWTTLQSAINTNKSRNSGIESKDFFREQLDNSAYVSLNQKYNTGDNVLKSIQADIVDLRSTFWNAFRYLFREYWCQ